MRELNRKHRFTLVALFALMIVAGLFALWMRAALFARSGDNVHVTSGAGSRPAEAPAEDNIATEAILPKLYGDIDGSKVRFVIANATYPAVLYRAGKWRVIIDTGDGRQAVKESEIWPGERHLLSRGQMSPEFTVDFNEPIEGGARVTFERLLGRDRASTWVDLESP